MTNSATTNTKKSFWTRRAFIITGSILGGGLVVGAGGMMYVGRKIKQYTGQGFSGDMLNAWISITPDNKITLAVPRAEMGQGVYTSVPMLIAEELEVEFDDIQVYHPQSESPYANTALMTAQPRDIYKGFTMMEKILAFVPAIATGGSTTIIDGYDHLRMTGAQAREMLKTVAANRWGVSPSEVQANKGYIFHANKTQKFSYGELVKDASQVKLDGLPTLKKAENFTLLGKPIKRLDIPEKVKGAAVFGLDVRLDNQLYAVIKHPSTIGGKILSIKNLEEVSSQPGVRRVLLTSHGAVVVANNTWRSKSAADMLEVEEDNQGFGNLNSASIIKLIDEAMAAPAIATPENHGDVDALLTTGGIIEAMYEVPYLAHACMEPINCTVLYKDKEKKAEVWCGHQAPSIAASVASDVLGITTKDIALHIVYLGGGFGRRAEIDMVASAAEIAKQLPNTPIQLVYTREEDMANDMYRPGVKSRFKAKVGNGRIIAWDNKLALQSVAASSMGRVFPMMAPKPKDDITTIEGAAHLPYNIEHRRISFGDVDLPIKVGFWRSVGNSQNGFFTESFIDECAHAANQDPYAFRMNHLKDQPRFAAVLDRVAKMADWGTSLPENTFQGISLHKSFGSIVGQVARIKVVEDKTFKIEKYFCAIDCGRIVNPDTIQAQMEGGINFGLTAAIFGEITFENGRVQQLNFPQYDMIRLAASPKVEVAIMKVDEYPGGVGEPGVPPVAAALTNAIYAATAQRVRSLPLTKIGYRFV